MKAKEIINEKTFIKYIKIYDSKNFNRYLFFLKQLKNNCIHDIYKLSSYVFQKMEDKEISNKYNYFTNSILKNISKLNKLTFKSIDKKPTWFDSDIKIKEATKEELKEIDDLLSKY